MMDYTPRQKLMVEKLYQQIQSGWIDDSCWEYEFILSIREKLKMNAKLSEKQNSKLEEIFERY